MIKPNICRPGPTGRWAGYAPATGEYEVMNIWHSHIHPFTKDKVSRKMFVDSSENLLPKGACFSPSFVRKCRNSSLAQGGSGRRVFVKQNKNSARVSYFLIHPHLWNVGDLCWGRFPLKQIKFQKEDCVFVSYFRAVIRQLISKKKEHIRTINKLRTENSLLKVRQDNFSL